MMRERKLDLLNNLGLARNRLLLSFRVEPPYPVRISWTRALSVGYEEPPHSLLRFWRRSSKTAGPVWDPFEFFLGECLKYGQKLFLRVQSYQPFHLLFDID